MKSRSLLVPAVLSLVAAAASADGVGSRVGEVELEGWSQTEARAFDDFTGRAVLIEFFAYW